MESTLGSQNEQPKTRNLAPRTDGKGCIDLHTELRTKPDSVRGMHTTLTPGTDGGGASARSQHLALRTNSQGLGTLPPERTAKVA
jgi:hypothetical protein